MTPTRSVKRQRWLLLALALAVGCAAEVGEDEGSDDEDIVSTPEPAVAFDPSSFTPWTLTGGKLPLCFSRDSSLSPR